MNLEVKFGNKRGKEFTTLEASKKFDIIYDGYNDKRYLFILEKTGKSKVKYYLHGNVLGDKFEEGNTYLPLKPLLEGVYTLRSYYQPKELPTRMSIDRYLETDIIDKYNLKFIESIKLKFTEDKNYIRLPEIQAKKCRCKLHVAEKQPEQCQVNPNLKEAAYDGSKFISVCYNPYAVCGKVGEDSKCEYDYGKMSTSKLLTLARMEKIKVTGEESREKLLKLLQKPASSRFSSSSKSVSSESNVTTFDDGVVGVWEAGPGKKKYKVVLYKTQKDYEEGKKWKSVTFGAKGYQQYKDQTPLGLYSSDDHLDEKRRNNYQARHGAQGYQERKYSPAWFSWNYLW